MTATLVYQVPAGDFGAYLLGPWKRTLECREFGKTYEHQRTSNSVVVIEHAMGVAAEPPTYVSGACARLCVYVREKGREGEVARPGLGGRVGRGKREGHARGKESGRQQCHSPVAANQYLSLLKLRQPEQNDQPLKKKRTDELNLAPPTYQLIHHFFPPSRHHSFHTPRPYTQPQFLNWKFGRSLEEEDLKLGYCMHFMRDTDITNLEWRYEGTCCVPGRREGSC